MKKIIVPAAIVGGLVFSATGQQALAASGQDVVNQALAYQGKPYAYGAPSFSESVFDCSSFTQLMYSKVMNVSLPRSSAEQANVGIQVSKDQLQPGDLLFFDTTGDGGIHHVGIYIGNGQMISSEITVGVHIANVFSGGGSQTYWEPRFKTARRIVETGSSVTAPVQENKTPEQAQPAQSSQPSGANSSAKTYTVKSGDSLWAIGNRNGLSVSKLKSLNGLKSYTIYPGQVLKLSGESTASPSSAPKTEPAEPSAPSSAPSSQQTSGSVYTVKSGDSLWAIANKNGMSVSALKSANSLKSDVIYPGQTLKLSASAAPSTNQVTQTSYSVAANQSSKSEGAYQVKKGDSLWEIATLHGVTVNKIMKANNLSSTLIYPGQHLLIPGKYI
ncbi:LysM peptidoglycan-binding domain-containing protein [Sporolactobacillus laevolacticus]|uniref:Autolysin n=1 Tax=Sporolactobacillus laevolacticus DSM 442 TaxID=1395513 RepID=V6IWW0_9BACL|nr:LysM peptidoglycan-binding domain-containing protein [Sporolactobacillus laevolacticus]EST11818.1 autolysin [Sporolactobacillus laevolacticus DSM 442]